MANPFFDHPILNSPYECPQRHWELDEQGQPTQKIIENRRRAEFITPIPKPKKRKKGSGQQDFVFDEGKGLSTQEQQYDPTSIINEVRGHVNRWRAWPNPSEWQVTPETARLLQHWRHHKFAGVRPFFCQVEAVETAIWLTEVAPQSKSGKQILENLAAANKDANPELLASRLEAGDRRRQDHRHGDADRMADDQRRAPARQQTASRGGFSSSRRVSRSKTASGSSSRTTPTATTPAASSSPAICWTTSTARRS